MFAKTGTFDKYKDEQYVDAASETEEWTPK